MASNVANVTDQTAAERAVRVLERLAMGLAATSFVVIVCVTVTDVVLRYAVHRPLMWAYDFISWYPMVALFFFAISDSWRSGHHIRVDLLIRHLSPRAKAGFGLLAAAVALCVIALIAYTGLLQFLASWDADERLTGVVEWPLWPSKLIVPLGAGLFGLRLLVDVVRDARVVAGAAIAPVKWGQMPRTGASDAPMIVTLVIVVLLLLIGSGVPIGFSMAFAGCLGLWLVGGSATLLGLVASTPLTTVSTYELLSIPLFLLMAEFVIASGIADEMYDCMCIWTGRTPGGLAIATALAGAGFGAITGSSTASAATLASTSLPAMIRHGYDRHLSTGVVAISGTLAMLVPPSLALVIYGLLTDLSIGKLLIAGIVPAALVTVAIILTVLGLVALDPSRAPRGQAYSWTQKLLATRATGPMVLLIVLVTGAIYTGLATPTESSALGAFGAFAISVVRGRMSRASFVAALVGAARTAAMISMIIIGAHLFGYALTLTQSTQSLVNWIGGLGANRYVVITLILLLKLVLGFFMDQLAIQLLTVPIMVPIIVSLGFDPVWFGVMIVLTAEVGMVTPPVGMNAFIVARYTGRPVEEVFWGAAPHVAAHLALIVLFVIFPAIVTWLPGTMAP